MSAVEAVRRVNASGAPCWTVSDELGRIVSALFCVDRWLIFTYYGGTPDRPLETTDEDTAREWVQWIAEQVVAARAAVVGP